MNRSNKIERKLNKKKKKWIKKIILKNKLPEEDEENLNMKKSHLKNIEKR